jgi:hypothetical protein
MQADRISISDLTGRVIENFKVNTSKGNIELNPALAAGTYLLNVYQQGNQMSTVKLVITE